MSRRRRRRGRGRRGEVKVYIFSLISFPITLTLYNKSDYDIIRGIYLLSLVNTTNITFEERYTLTFPQSVGKYEYTLPQSAGKYDFALI